LFRFHDNIEVIYDVRHIFVLMLVENVKLT